MEAGRSIRIFLASGEVTGIRHAELVNWTGQAIACPRSRLDELEKWEEAWRPGVYMLFGAEGPSEREAYIGESENVMKRIRQHLGKEFWQEVVVFTSKDENLTKSHVRYLEHRLVFLAKKAGRYKLKNANDANETALPRADKAAMEEFIENLGILIGALGHRVLAPVAGSAKVEEFRFSTKGATARGAPTDEGFVVREGSTALNRALDSMGAGNIALKQTLLQGKTLVADGDLLRFTADYLFSTPSQAGSMVSGTSCNGRISWKRVSDGKTLKEIEEAAQGGEDAPAGQDGPGAEV